jgi:hypothetical protein
VYPLHHPQFRVDESAMALGTAVLIAGGREVHQSMIT